MPEIENSGFDNSVENFLDAGNFSAAELLPIQSNGSEVYRIRIKDRWLLLKRISPEFRNNPLYIAALEKEFNIGFSLDHPNIVKYLNKGSDNDGMYILAEYIDGITLRSLIEKNAHGISDKKLIEKIVQQLLDALDYLHSNNILHLDLKPENILITFKGSNVKLIDFGMSVSDSYISISSGTRKYCSPEQLSDPENADTGYDFFSLGLIILEMFTGSTELSGVGKLPHRHRKIIRKCLESDRKKRFQSAHDILKELAERKTDKAIIAFAGIVLIATIAIFISFFIASKNQSRNDKTNTALSINADNSSPVKKEHVELDSNAAHFQRNNGTSESSELTKILSSPLPIDDSIKMCKLGNNLFSEFLKRVEIYDRNPGPGSRKLELIKIKGQCIEDLQDSSKVAISHYRGNNILYLKLLEVYSKYENKSEEKIDEYIYNKKKSSD